MEFNRFNMPKSREDIDRFVREYGLRPSGTVSYKGRDIFIAETDLETDKPEEYPWGYYQVAWFVTSPKSMEKLDLGSWAEYEAMHDKDQSWTPRTKRVARVNDVVNRARHFIDSSEEVGRYAD